MKRRYLYILMAMALVLTACGAKQAPQDSAQPPEAVTQEPAPEPKPEPEVKPEPETTREPAPAPELEPEPEPDPDPEPDPEINLDVVCASMVEAAEVTDPWYLGTESFSNLYGIDPSWVAQSAGFVTMSGVFPDEVAIFEAVNAEAAAQIADCLQTRLDEVMVQAETYDPDSYAKAKECGVVTNGNFVRMLLSPKQAELASAYGQYIQ